MYFVYRQRVMYWFWFLFLCVFVIPTGLQIKERKNQNIVMIFLYTNCLPFFTDFIAHIWLMDSPNSGSINIFGVTSENNFNFFFVRFCCTFIVHIFFIYNNSYLRWIFSQFTKRNGPYHTNKQVTITLFICFFFSYSFHHHFKLFCLIICRFRSFFVVVICFVTYFYDFIQWIPIALSNLCIRTHRM